MPLIFDTSKQNPRAANLFSEDLANLRGFLGREIAEAEITDRDEGKARGVCPPPTDAPEEGGNLSLF